MLLNSDHHWLVQERLLSLSHCWHAWCSG